MLLCGGNDLATEPLHPRQEPEKEGSWKGLCSEGQASGTRAGPPPPILEAFNSPAHPTGGAVQILLLRGKGVSQKRGLDPAHGEFFPLQFTGEGLELPGASAGRSENPLADSQGRPLCHRKNLSPKHYCSRFI